MIWVLLVAGAVVVLGAPLRRVRRAMRPGRADPELLAALAEQHPMKRRQLVVDAMGSWTTAEHDGPVFQALLAEVMAVTREP